MEDVQARGGAIASLEEPSAAAVTAATSLVLDTPQGMLLLLSSRRRRLKVVVAEGPSLWVRWLLREEHGEERPRDRGPALESCQRHVGALHLSVQHLPGQVR